MIFTKNNTMKTNSILLLSLFSAILCPLGQAKPTDAAPPIPVAQEDSLADSFKNPPDKARPAIFGFMLPFESVPDAVITRDIEEMKAKGITSCLIYTPGLHHSPRGNGKVVYGDTDIQVVKTNEFEGTRVESEKLAKGNLAWSAEWRRAVRCAARVAGRVGLELGISIGGIGCELMDLPAEYGEQTLVHSSTAITGPVAVRQTLPLPVGIPLNRDKKPQFYRDIAVLALPAKGTVALEAVIDLTGKVDDQGRLSWDAPKGDWLIYRLGHSLTEGARVIDHLSIAALNAKWAAHMGSLLKEMTPEERRGVTYVECDSYEGKAVTWTAEFAKEFRLRRGYDITPWLPVLAKRVVGDADQSARFHKDYQLTISDLFADNHYAHHTKLAKENGLRFCAEAAGPHQKQTDMLKSLSRSDIAMGEFWMPGSHRGVSDARRYLLRDAAAAAHGYGTKEVFCEALTGGNDPWQEAPKDMKACVDQAFCDGLTRLCIHGYSISPWLDDAPGVAYWAGVYASRLTTWWNHSPDFFTYLGRCSQMLSQGLFVADVVFYNGDGINVFVPRKAVLGKALDGQYDYDHCNSEILLTRMSAKDGRIVLPDGMSYGLMVQNSKEPLSLAVLNKLAELVEGGVTLLGDRPTGGLGLQDDPAACTAMIERIWGKVTTDKIGEHRLGKGRVIWGKSVKEVLAEMKIQPDVEITGTSPKGVMDWIHRRQDGTDIYFIASRWYPTEKVECTFRVSGKIPELWNPVTGEIREAGAFRQEQGRTVVPLSFTGCESIFVVFRKPTLETARTGVNEKSLKMIQNITEPWTVHFDPRWGGPETTVFSKLEDWTLRAEDGIKYYSGTATYNNKFTLTANVGKRLFLDLGTVREIASVRVNGQLLGNVWCAPWRVDITQAAKPGTNTLEISVANLWVNRLVGDTFLPKGQRFTRTNQNKYSQNTLLHPSGLLGPVQVLTSE
jgi:hypothetical protein